MNLETQENGRPTTGTVEEERRSSYRISVKDTETPVQGEMTLDNGDTYPIEIINYSGVGLLCYVPATARLSLNTTIPRIKLMFDRKEPVYFSGQIVRLEKGEARYFCGLRFGEPGYSRKPANRRKLTSSYEITDEIRAKWIHELKSIPNYLFLNQSEEQIHAEKVAYERFSHITGRLSIEERWWFFEMLDELKRKEPFYPQRLLEEFIGVCEWGYFSLASQPPWHVQERGMWSRLKTYWRSLIRKVSGNRK